jgi:hypothetical protein
MEAGMRVSPTRMQSCQSMWIMQSERRRRISSWLLREVAKSHVVKKTRTLTW